MANNLYSWPTACAAPEKLAGRMWDRLNAQKLACMEQSGGHMANRSITIIYSKNEDQCSNRLEMSWARAIASMILNGQLSFSINEQETHSLLLEPQVTESKCLH